MVTYGTTYPAAGPGGLTDANWRRLAGAWGNGIVNALGSSGSSSFALARSASDRTVTLHLDEFRIQGVHFEPTQATLTLTVPAVAAGSTRADRLLARYDPLAAQADRITFYIKTGTATATGTPGLPTFQRENAGVWEIPLYTWSGGNVAANALAVTDQRVFVGEMLHGLARPGLNSELNLGRTDGSRFYDATTGETWVCTYPGGVATWSNIDNAEWTPLDLGSSLKAGAHRPEYRVVHGRFEMHGQAGLRTGSWVGGGNDLGAGVLPAAISDRISWSHVFPMALINTSDPRFLVTRVVVASSGNIFFNLPTGVSVGQVSYDSISFGLD